MAESEWTERAGAKINLGLKILGKRSDGYHDILSVVQGIDLADTLHFKTAQHSSMTCTDPDIPCNGDNLVLQALALFSQRAPVSCQPLAVHLEKRIPVGAGLGGGLSLIHI